MVVAWSVKNIDDWRVRIAIYFIMFNVLELIGGILGEKIICKLVDTCENRTKMWDYSKSTYNIWGYVDLWHAVVWTVLGVVGGQIIRVV